MVVPEADRLFELPLEEFTTARDAVASALKEAGRAEDARGVKKLRKPTLPAWLLNQLAREHRLGLEALIDAKRKMGEADSAAALREAAEERRVCVRRLTDTAERLASAAGHGSASALEMVERVLLAGWTQAEAETILQGRLTRPPEIEPNADLWAAGPAVAEPEADDDDERRREVEELEAAADEAERSASSLEVAAERARREAERVADEAIEARHRATQARRRARDAARRLG